MRDFAAKMATKPSSGTDCPPRARIRNSRPGLLPEAASAGAPERRLFVPERGFVAIFGPISRTMGRAQADGERPDKPAGVRRRAARPESRHPAADGLERFSRKARWPQPSSTEIRASPSNRDSHDPQCRSPSPSPKARRTGGTESAKRPLSIPACRTASLALMRRRNGERRLPNGRGSRAYPDLATEHEPFAKQRRRTLAREGALSRNAIRGRASKARRTERLLEREWSGSAARRQPNMR